MLVEKLPRCAGPKLIFHDCKQKFIYKKLRMKNTNGACTVS